MSELERQSTEQVYAQVREAILDGELAPGTVMSQVAFADELGVSRTPLREALRMLQSEGLIDAEPNRRVRVALMSPADLEDLCVIRVTLDYEALLLSIPRMTPENLAGLEGYMAEMAHYAAAEDYRRWVVPHRAFHSALTAPAGRRLNRLLEQLFDHAERYRRFHIGHGPSAWATAGHRDILDACKRGDSELGARLLANHLSRTAFEVSELLDPSYDLVKLKETLGHVGAEPPRPVSAPARAHGAARR